MVLLGMPRGVDVVWARRLAVRRHHNAHGGRPASEGVPGGLLRLQAQLVGVGGYIVVAFSMLFAALFAFAIMKLNFQKR